MVQFDVYLVFVRRLSRVTRDEVKEKKNKENQLNGGFEVSNCHSTTTARATMCMLYACMYIFDV